MSGSMLNLLLVVLAQPADPEGISLGDIEARLFYKETGRLSEDILSRREEFIFHNTIIGEGSAEEAADDLLISVEMSAGKFGSAEQNHRYLETPVTIVARDSRGRILGQRTHGSVLTSYRGSEHKVLWLNDATCAGDVTITATFGRQTKTATLPMHCGE